MTSQILEILGKHRFSLENEAILKKQMYQILHQAGIPVVPEHALDKRSRLDFFIDGIAIEVKIKGSRMAIYKQCARYCAHPDVKVLILVTNRAMTLPEINDKPTYVVHIGRGWL